MTLEPVSIAAVAVIAAAVAVAWGRKFVASGALVVANLFIFALTAFGPHMAVGDHVIPVIHAELSLHPQNLDPLNALGALEVITAMFVHANFWHLFGNVIILLAFALPFEERIGPRAFLLLYFVTGIVGSLLQVGMTWGSNVSLLGASGAVFGVIGSFAAAYPNLIVPLPLPLMVMVIFVRMRVWIAAVVFGALEVLYLQFLSPFDNTAHWAHLGGLLSGLLLGSAVVRRSVAHKRSQPVRVDLEALVPFARDAGTTQALNHMRANSDEPAIFQAWLDRFFRSATCPTCSHKVAPRHRGEVVCTQGHRFDVRSDRPKPVQAQAMQA